MITRRRKCRIPIIIGQTFCRLTVKGEAPTRKAPSGSSQRMVYVSCSCGEERTVALCDLRRGQAKSCGCYSRDAVIARSTRHGEYKERLYICWTSMIRRSRRRGCKIFPAWVQYEGFRDWALSTGYEAHLVLCRNGDVGDYTPTNSRWDTPRNNAREAHAVLCEVTYPDGTVEVIRNISEFCRINGLSKSAACSVSRGRGRHHKGYKFRRLDGESYEISNKDG